MNDEHFPSTGEIDWKQECPIAPSLMEACWALDGAQRLISRLRSTMEFGGKMPSEGAVHLLVWAEARAVKLFEAITIDARNASLELAQAGSPLFASDENLLSVPEASEFDIPKYEAKITLREIAILEAHYYDLVLNLTPMEELSGVAFPELGAIRDVADRRIVTLTALAGQDAINAVHQHDSETEDDAVELN